MTFKNSIKTAVAGLITNKSRSALTILGIVIGITAIILVVSIGNGAEDLILDQVRGVGSRTIAIRPGREPQGPSDFIEFFTDSLKERDVKALMKKSNVHGLAKIAPLVFTTATVAHGNETIRSTIYGGSELLVEILDVYPEAGFFFDDSHVKQFARVAVVGKEVKDELFGDNDALGQRVKIKDQTFRVIGILPDKGQVGFVDVDDAVIVPYSTAQKYLLGINYYHEILAQAQTEEVVDEAVHDIALTLREMHGITDPDKDDFNITTQADIVERIGVISTVLSALLVSIAGISLVVGGIGIMNIMLVSVAERTREIGLRKALGATDDDILTQFLLEAVLLTGAGGVIGSALGFGLSLITAIVLSKTVAVSWSFIFSPTAAIFGIAVSSIIGVVFGLYPARKAAKKHSIDALRYE